MPASAASTPKKVLVAEGDPRLAQLIEELLRRWGLEVTVARDGREALRKILARKPDVILLDSTLPGMAGVDICSILHRNQTTRTIPLGFLTGDRDSRAATAAQRAGAMMLIPKSFKPEQLINSVAVLLSAREKKLAA